MNINIKNLSEPGSNPLLTIVIYELKESLRNMRVLVYGGALAGFGSLVLFFSGKSPQAAASLLNLVLLIVPLFGLLFGALSFRDSLPFMQLLLSRGVDRTRVYLGKWLGLSISLGVSVAFGLGVSAIFGKKSFTIILFLMSLAVGLQFVFVSLSMLLGVVVRKREMIPGAALLIWFYLYVLYDLLVLYAGTLSNEYPLEIPVFVLLILNPLDLVRLIFLIQTDLSQLMGFSTALAVRTLGGKMGAGVAFLLLAIWTAAPLYAGLRIFKNRDL